MSKYPRTVWTFGPVNCEIRQVELVERSRFGDSEFDVKGEAYRPCELYASEREALAGVKAYLDRKQAVIDKQQANIDRRRNFLRQQLSVCK